jgi:hypothetical protein
MAWHQLKELRAAASVQALCLPLALAIALLTAPAHSARSQRAARLQPAGGFCFGAHASSQLPRVHADLAGLFFLCSFPAVFDDPALDEQCFSWSMNHRYASTEVGPCVNIGVYFDQAISKYSNARTAGKPHAWIAPGHPPNW